MFTIIAFVIMFKINYVITLFIFIPLNLIVIIARRSRKRIAKYRRNSRREASNLSGVIGEIFTSVQLIKVYGSENNIVNHVKQLNKKKHNAMLKDTLFTQLLNSVYGNTITVGTGVILLLTAKAMQNNNFSIGDFALFVYYLNYITDFSQRLGEFLAHIKQSEISFERISELLQEENLELIMQKRAVYRKGDVPEPIVKDDFPLKSENKFKKLVVTNLSYTYPNSKKGINNLSFYVSKGSFTVITGRIGCGKTTLLRSLLGLIPHESGEIYWNSQKIEATDLFFVPPKVAYTSQVPHLFNDTLKENISLGEKNYNLDAVLHSAVLEDDIKNLENGVETLIGPLGAKLSGGQVQRVAAARMFARESELFVFDDISSALDVETEKKLWNRLAQKKNITCIAVSNKKIALQNADNIIVMKDGCIEAQGTFEQLYENCEEFRQLCGMENINEDTCMPVNFNETI